MPPSQSAIVGKSRSGGSAEPLQGVFLAHADATPQSQSSSPQLPPPLAQIARPWHVDAWYGWRPGSALPRVAAGGPLGAAYGGTQGGVLVRYDLGRDGRRPQIYLRAVHAPSRPAQNDLAAGLGLRPLPGVPVRFQGEARVTRTGADARLRPAIAAVSELPPVELPMGFRIEAYGQAGWVGGRESTGFVDGQARMDRSMADIGGANIRLGLGAWGGAQKYAGRLDIGPSLSLDLRDIGLPARAMIDYRVKIAGHARPENGVAVTVLTGF